KGSEAMSYNEWASMETGELVLIYGIMILITAISYCIIPIILRFTLIKKRELPIKRLSHIAILNSVGVKLAYIVYEFAVYGYSDFSGLWYATPILYFFVNRWILRSGNRKYHKAELPFDR
ncbi:MAG: hypothetical protein Q4A54_12145, partial [Parabacteroides sp.]|nr:hypothetical protein [Parabacteroides sp.]